MDKLQDKAAEQIGEMKDFGKKARASAALRSTGFWVAVALVAALFAGLILTGA
ncbi:MAG: hypothetical protein ACTS10_21960 [Kiloniellales bacterium]